MPQKVGLVMPTLEGPMSDTPFQTMAEVDEYLSGNTIECLICAKSFQRLNRHLQYVHNIAPDDYRRRFGIPFKRSLTSVPSRAKSGSAMTPERILQLIRVSQVGKPGFPRGTNREHVPAVADQWRKNVARSWHFARKLVIVSCPKCGCDVATTALGATQPAHCMKCTTPGARRAREYYWRKKWAA
jgi:hypothetical protein